VGGGWTGGRLRNKDSGLSNLCNQKSRGSSPHQITIRGRRPLESTRHCIDRNRLTLRKGVHRGLQL